MLPSNTSNLYDRLQIVQDSTFDEIRSAYRKQVLEWHPDKNPDNEEQSHLEFIAVSEAYEILSVALKKREYDAKNHYSSYYSERASNRDAEERRKAREEAFKYYEDICEKIFGKDSAFTYVLKMPEIRSSFWLFSDIFADIMKGGSKSQDKKKIEE